jgi:hypothetical protein
MLTQSTPRHAEAPNSAPQSPSSTEEGGNTNPSPSPPHASQEARSQGSHGGLPMERVAALEAQEGRSQAIHEGSPLEQVAPVEARARRLLG